MSILNPYVERHYYPIEELKNTNRWKNVSIFLSNSFLNGYMHSIYTKLCYPTYTKMLKKFEIIHIKNQTFVMYANADYFIIMKTKCEAAATSQLFESCFLEPNETKNYTLQNDAICYSVDKISNNLSSQTIDVNNSSLRYVAKGFWMQQDRFTTIYIGQQQILANDLTCVTSTRYRLQETLPNYDESITCHEITMDDIRLATIRYFFFSKVISSEEFLYDEASVYDFALANDLEMHRDEHLSIICK